MNNKRKNIIMVVSVMALVILTVGVAFAAFTYNKSGKASNLVLGDIYMHYRENNALLLENALPGDDYSKYFEFTISGKNTYEEKDIWYDFLLTRGEVPEGKIEANRIPDKYLKFKLVKVNSDNTETVLFTNRTYDDIQNQRIYVETISKNTLTEINNTYRLYMVISNDLGIGNTESTTYTPEEYANAFASVKINVTGDFEEKVAGTPASKTMLKAIENNTTDACNPIFIDDDETKYFSGRNNCVKFNYVWYSGKLWRITAIYPDGTMKMITEDLITTINWGEKATVSETDTTSAYSTSWMREWLNQEFLPTLHNYENLIVTDAPWYSILPSSGKTPEKPNGQATITNPVGLLNIYEYYMALRNISSSISGAGVGGNYLNIGYRWWLITPTDSSRIYYIHQDDGTAWADSPSTQYYGVRPSISLKSTVQFESGTGLLNDPYTIKGDKGEITSNITYLNTRSSGEYIKLENDNTNQLFRIIDTETISGSLTTKLVLNDYVRDKNDIDSDNLTTEVLTKAFSSQYFYELWTEADKTSETYWRGYLNNTWLKEIDNTYNETTGTSNILEKGTYYLGYHKTGSYKATVCNTVSSEKSIDDCIETKNIVNNIVTDDYVGLLRLGEMFASQSKIYTHETASSMWLITPYKNSSSGYIDVFGDIRGRSADSDNLTVRPTINLKSTIVIKSGSGTESDPFVVGLPS